jgi:hypothetical protein
MRIISSGSSEQWKESVILPRLRKMQTDELGGLLAVGALTRGLKSRPFILIRPKALFCLQMVVREQEYLVPQRVASQGALASIFYSLRATLPSDSHVYRPAASASTSLLLASAIVSFYSFICFQPPGRHSPSAIYPDRSLTAASTFQLSTLSRFAYSRHGSAKCNKTAIEDFSCK